MDALMLDAFQPYMAARNPLHDVTLAEPRRNLLGALDDVTQEHASSKRTHGQKSNGKHEDRLVYGIVDRTTRKPDPYPCSTDNGAIGWRLAARNSFSGNPTCPPR